MLLFSPMKPKRLTEYHAAEKHLSKKDGYRILKSLDKPPTSKELTAIGLAFKPYRTIASWYLWQVPRPPKVKR
jgi:3-methyladenine DNA glycosylase/8-oxoguanine DNA glycosylase